MKFCTTTALTVCCGLAVAILCGLSPSVATQSGGSAAQNESAENARMVFSRALPRLDGNHLKVTIVEVSYGPGESSPPHSHPCPVIGYVVEGALQTQVKGEAEAIYRAGESFYEAPNGIHQVSANASATKPVKFLAYFVCDHDTPLSVGAAETPGAGGRRP
jgi:quercetin dioxygenase-like cupin family protein